MVKPQTNRKLPNSRIQHNAPHSGILKYWFGRLCLQITGWKIVDNLPPEGKFLIVGAPHTSNWDFPLALLTVFTLRLKIAWMGKHTIFRKPFGGFMRWLGGIAINRSSSSGVVDQIADKFKTSEKLVLALAAEGTRKKSDYWKSGFYWIALKAQVPIVCGYLDYPTREAGFGLSFIPTGDMKKDMDRIREFFCDKRGKIPENASTVRLRDEGT